MVWESEAPIMEISTFGESVSRRADSILIVFCSSFIIITQICYLLLFIMLFYNLFMFTSIDMEYSFNIGSAEVKCGTLVCLLG